MRKRERRYWRKTAIHGKVNEREEKRRRKGRRNMQERRWKLRGEKERAVNSNSGLG